MDAACRKLELGRPGWRHHIIVMHARVNWPAPNTCVCAPQLHPLVPPQVSHLRQVPLRTSVKLPHSRQLSPS